MACRDCQRTVNSELDSRTEKAPKLHGAPVAPTSIFKIETFSLTSRTAAAATTRSRMVVSGNRVYFRYSVSIAVSVILTHAPASSTLPFPGFVAYVDFGDMHHYVQLVPARIAS